MSRIPLNGGLGMASRNGASYQLSEAIHSQMIDPLMKIKQSTTQYQYYQNINTQFSPSTMNGSSQSTKSTATHASQASLSPQVLVGQFTTTAPNLDQFSENSTCYGSEEGNPEDFLDQMVSVNPTPSQFSSSSMKIITNSGSQNSVTPFHQNFHSGLKSFKQGMQLQPNLSTPSGQVTQVYGASNTNKPTVQLEEAKYKTEMCKNWVETNKCNYSEKCKFAHGKHELVQKIAANKHFKTKNCKQFFESGTCNYGPRCHFLHDTRQIEELTTQMFYQKRILNCAAFFDSKQMLSRPATHRLPCFQNLTNL